MRYGNAGKEEFIEFFLKYFDVNGNGFVNDKEFESMIDILFGGGEDPAEQAKQKGKNESVSDNLKVVCQNQGVY